MTRKLYKHGPNAAAPIPNKSRFAINPILRHHRSKFNRNKTISTTFNVGDIVPIYTDEIYPDDTINIDIAAVVRTFTPATAVMDNLFLDIYAFFVPMRLCYPFTGDNSDLTTNGYSLWHRFMGENTGQGADGIWATKDLNTLTLPQISTPKNGWNINSLADMLELPTNTPIATTISAHFFNAYITIYNEWFRDQNFNPMIPLIATGFNKTYNPDELSNKNIFHDAALGLNLLPAQKLPDYFTTALPQPQKGESIGIFGTIKPDQSAIAVGTGYTYDGPLLSDDPIEFNVKTTNRDFNQVLGCNINKTGLGQMSYNTTDATLNNLNTTSLGGPTNLAADVSTLTFNSTTTINEFRLAFQIQKYLERNARGGTRYTEIIANHWGVHTGDARQQRPELIGAHRELINHHQIAQTSETNGTPLATIAAYGHKTFNANNKIIKSFTEHGVLMIVGIVRQEHSYNQGIQRKYTRKTLYDFYDPLFATLGEQAIYNYEIACDGNIDNENAIFGYKPCWNELRYNNNAVKGLFRPDAQIPDTYDQIGLGQWTYTDNYRTDGKTITIPKLSQGWLQETRDNVDRTLAINANAKIPAYQLFGNFYLTITETKALPIDGVPGLVDHH